MKPVLRRAVSRLRFLILLSMTNSPGRCRWLCVISIVKFAPGGVVDIDAKDFLLSKTGGDINSIKINGQIAFKHCALNTVVPISDLNGSLGFDAAYTASDNNLKPRLLSMPGRSV